MARLTLLFKIFSLALTALAAITFIGYVAGHALIDNDKQHIQNVLKGALTEEMSAIRSWVTREIRDIPPTQAPHTTDQDEEDLLPEDQLNHLYQHFTGAEFSAVLHISPQRSVLAHRILSPKTTLFALEKLRFDLLPLINQAEKIPVSPTNQEAIESFSAFVLQDNVLQAAVVSPVYFGTQRTYAAVLKRLDETWLKRVATHYGIPEARFVAASPSATHPETNSLAIHGSYGGDLGWLVWPAPPSNPLIHNLVLFGALSALVLAILSWIIFRRFTTTYTPHTSLEKVASRSIHVMENMRAGLAELLTDKRLAQKIETLLSLLEAATGKGCLAFYLGYSKDIASGLKITQRLASDPRYYPLTEHLSISAEPVSKLHQTVGRREMFEIVPGRDPAWREFLAAHRSGLLDDERITLIQACPVADDHTLNAALILVRLGDTEAKKWQTQMMRLFADILASAIHSEQAPLGGQQLMHLDPLTHLANRFQLHLHLDKENQRRNQFASAEKQFPPLLVQFAVTNLEALTAEYGHAVGDNLITEMASRLRQHCQPADTLARTGAGEFTLFSLCVQSLEESVHLIHSTLETLSAPYFTEGITLYPRPHAGALVIRQSRDTPDQLMLQVEEARKSAQQSRDPMAFHFVHPEDHDAAQQCQQLLEALPGVLDKADLEVRYLPLINLRENRLEGIEALVYLPHPSLSQVSTDRIIRMAETMGEIERIDISVLRKASYALNQLDACGLGGLTLSINMSAQSLLNPGLFLGIQELLALKGIPPTRIQLGLNEQGLFAHGDSIRTLSKQIVASGMTFAIDRVHPHSTSIAHLTLFPLHQLKLDQSAIVALPEDARQRREISALAALASTLQAEVVAVGVETRHQLNALQLIGIQYVQGFLFGSPLDDEDLISGLESLKLQLQQDFTHHP